MWSLLKLSLPIALLVLAGCGGASIAPFTPTPPPAGAQVLSLTNLSAVVGPLNVITATCTSNGLTARVKHVVPNSPVAGQAGISLAVDICISGTITLAHTFPASAANDGTYTIVAHNPGWIGVTVTCSGCVTYDDDPGQLPPNNNCTPGTCSLSGDGFPVVVTDGGGLTHLLFIRGMAQGFNPAAFMEMTTSDGVTFTNPSLIAADTSMSCTQGGFASNCSYWSIMAGKLPNGNVIAMMQILNWATGSSLGVFWYVYDINTHSWGARQTFTQAMPDATTLVASYGRFFINGTSACAGMFNSKNYTEAWYGCTTDNGATFSGFHLLPPTINEGIVVPAGGSNLVGIWRTPRATSLTTCASGTPGVIPGCGALEILKSTDSGATWSSAFGPIGAQGSGVTNWELVGMDAFCATPTLCGVFWGERDYTTGYGKQLFAPFNPLTLVSDPSAFGTVQVLSSTNQLPPSDCCYISADKMANGKLLIVWYHAPASTNTAWKLFYQTAEYATGYALTLSNMQVTGKVQ